MNISGSVAVISGGASGLGEASVRKLVADGAKVAVLDLNETQGRKLVSELGPAAVFLAADVSDEKSVQTALDQVLAEFGALHIAVSCAGVGTPMKVIGQEGPMPIAEFNRTLQINLVGTMNVVRLAAARMSANSPNADGERGIIINTSSVAAFEGQIGQAAYAASKAGIVGMTLPIARELAEYGIRVMTIAPGLFLTPMLAALPEKVQDALSRMMPFPKRLGKPSEYALLVGQIIENPMLNGETIRLDAALRLSSK